MPQAAPQRSKMPVLPTLLTLGNAVCGLGSISYAAAGVAGNNGNDLLMAGVFIFAAMVFDMLDGSAARWTRQATKFGGELDSLCDAISFGVAPAFIILQMADAYPRRIVWAIAALYMACTVLRLARFNVETETEDKHESFSGLPSPAAAATIGSFAIVASQEFTSGLPYAAASLLPTSATVMSMVRNSVPIVALVLAGLMVSRIRYPHLAKQALQGKRQFRQVAQIVFAIAAIVALGVLSAPVILCAFVIGAPISATYNRLHKPRAARAEVPRGPARRLNEMAADNGATDSLPQEPAKMRLWWPGRGRRPRRRA